MKIFLPQHRFGWWRVAATLGAIALTLTLLLPRPTLAKAIGANAPLFTATTLTGETVSLQAPHGPVLLAFFAPDCEPSANAVSGLNRLHAERPTLIIIAVLRHADAAQARAWVTQTGADFPVVADSTDSLAGLYHPYVSPFWFFIGADNVIAFTALGEHKNNRIVTRAAQVWPLEQSQP